MYGAVSQTHLCVRAFLSHWAVCAIRTRRQKGGSLTHSLPFHCACGLLLSLANTQHYYCAESASGAFHNGRVRRAHNCIHTHAAALPYSFLSCRPLELLKWRALAANKCINYFNWTRTGTSYLSQPHQSPLCRRIPTTQHSLSNVHYHTHILFLHLAYPLRPKKIQWGLGNRYSNFITKVRMCCL